MAVDFVDKLSVNNVLNFVFNGIITGTNNLEHIVLLHVSNFFGFCLLPQCPVWALHGFTVGSRIEIDREAADAAQP